jgi:hypothetical protein
MTDAHRARLRKLLEELAELAKDGAAALADDGRLDVAEVIEIAGDILNIALAIGGLLAGDPETRRRRRAERRARRRAAT